jgi:hypothetical protein
MKLVKKSIVGLAAVLALGIGGSQAGTDLNEVAAFLVFPGVVATDRNGTVETWITITNGSSSPTDVHVSYINGSDYNDTECYECDFDIPMTGFDTETMVFVRLFDQTNIVSLDGTIIMACPWKYGFVTANTQDPITGEATTNNYLLGEEVVIDYTNGSALSVSAVSFQGKNGGNGDTRFAFDDDEYGKLPKVVAADFIAPTLDALRQSLGLPLIDASLTLFTLGFDRQYPPEVDCSVTGYDAFEHDFSTSFKFGCWTHIRLQDIHPEFAFPNLGNLLFDTHGWLRLNCRVDSDDNGTWDAIGGVHGAITQVADLGAIFHSCRDQVPCPKPVLGGNAEVGRLLYQSVTTGDAVTLYLEDTETSPGLE